MRRRFAKIKSSLKDKDFLIKLFLCFGVLFAGFLILIKIFFVNLNQMAKEDAVAQSNEKFVRNTKVLNNTLQNIYRNGIILLQDDLIIANMKNYDELTLENRLALPNVLQMLTNLTTREESVLHAYLFVDDKKVFLESGIYDTESFYGQFHKYSSSVSESIITARSPTEVMTLEMPRELSEENKTTYVMPMIIRRVGSNIILVQEIELSELGNILAEHSESYQDYFITCNDTVIYQSNDNAEELTYYLSPAFTDGKKGILLQENVLYDMKVFCVINYAALESKISEKYQPLMNLYVLFFAIICVLIVGMSLKLYNPILNLREIILKESKKGEENCHRISMEKILFHNKYPVSEAEQMKLMESLFSGGQVRCAVVEIIPESVEHNPMQEFDNAQKFLFEEMVQCLLKAILCETLNAYVIVRNYLSYIVVISGSDVSEHKVREAFQGVRKIFQYDYSFCKIKVGVGEKTESIREIQRSYFLAETMAELYENDSKFQFFIYEDNQIIYSIDSDKEKLQKIDNIIKSGNDKALNVMLYEWQEEMKHKKVIVQEQKQFWYSAFRRICKLAQEEKLDFYEITGIEENYFSFGSISTTEGFSSYIEYVSKAANSLCNYYKSRSFNMKERMDEIVDYIHTNYERNIGLTEIADYFKISPHYLSRIFKSYTTKNLSNYIAEYRIAIAKEMLLNTDKPITTIAEEVGIMSKATFLRTFKNTVGISPTEFRKTNRGKDQEEEI